MWIEISMLELFISNAKSHLLREMWIEISMLELIISNAKSHHLREMWIEILKMNLIHHVQNESSPAGDVD